MQISFRIPMDVDDRSEFQNADAVVAMARALEDAGVDACHLTDHPAPTAKWREAGGHDALDPFAALAFVAAAARRLKLHTNIVVLPYRNPFLAAKSAATLDVLSEGRLILGVGGGYMRGEFAALGVDFDTRGAQLDTALETMKAVWRGETVVRQTPTFNAVGNMARPLPVQQPNPPIWIGGNGDRAMRRAVEHGDGWSPFFASGDMQKTTRTDEISSLKQLGEKLDQLRGMLARAGRSGPYDICAPLAGGLDIGRDADVGKLISQAERLAAMGVTWVTVVTPHPSLSDYLKTVDWFGKELAPAIKAL
jgi:probable F420-dependent oxidoreductase